MRTTIVLDDELLAKAQALTPIQEKSSLIKEALKALIERESAKRLANLGGSEPQLEAIPRRQASTWMMVLVDTSVWVGHLRSNEPRLAGLLTRNQVLSHPFVRGELALGNLRQRDLILSALDNLPQAPIAFADEVNFFIESHSLFGLGIGLIDVHLLAATQLMGNAKLWTRDKRLLAAASRLNLVMVE